MLDDKLARIKKLIAKREEVDAELSELLGITEKTRRGKHPKEQPSNGENEAERVATAQSTLT
jgi:hypothetical protein